NMEQNDIRNKTKKPTKFSNFGRPIITPKSLLTTSSDEAPAKKSKYTAEIDEQLKVLHAALQSKIKNKSPNPQPSTSKSQKNLPIRLNSSVSPKTVCLNSNASEELTANSSSEHAKKPVNSTPCKDKSGTRKTQLFPEDFRRIF
ncbi:uncharacterized protein LOC117182518, partial [Belonocnema kinseyi]|uniref:uncharacterized protein LOC117182518 n=1 Tax=Belonocnema kinseyi TaxID=2817044 RepID=UPI00143D9EA5